MKPIETTEQKLTRISHEVGDSLRKQAGDRWNSLRTARRKLENRYVWRFRSAGDPDRYLHLSHSAMMATPAATLLAQLDQAGWLDRMQAGPETSFMLASTGKLRARTVQ